MKYEAYLPKIEEELRSVLEMIHLSQSSGKLILQYFDKTKNKYRTEEGVNTQDIKIILSKVVYEYYKKNQHIEGIIKDNFLIDLKAAYRSGPDHPAFLKGWFLEENLFDNMGSILVNKDNYYRKQALSGAYLSDEYPLEINMPVSVRWYLTSNTDIFDITKDRNSFYEVSGKHLPNDYLISDILIRFYFNLNPLAPNFRSLFISFFKKITLELNRRFVPFQFKILYETLNMRRSDSAVLYVDKRYFFLLINFIHAISEEFDSILGSDTPMFTFPIAKGIGFAEQPPFEKTDGLHFLEIPSFGQHRAALIAYGIIDRFLSNSNDNNFDQKDPVQLIEYLSRINKSAGFIINILPNMAFSTKTIDSGPIQSAFFLNKKSMDYPYVHSYFDLTYDKGLNDSACEVHNTPSSDLIEEIGYKLCSEAIWDAYSRCSWIGFVAKTNSYQTIDNSLIDGLAGIILFLHGAFEQTGNETFSMYRDGAAKCLTYKLMDKIIWVKKRPVISKQTRLRHGYHKGDLMAVFILMKKKLIFQKVWQASPKNIIDRIEMTDPDLFPLTVYDGLSGTVLSLLELYSLDESIAEYRTKALEIGLIILNHLFKYDTDRSEWILSGANPEIGFSSGASGIAYTFLKLSEVLNNQSENKKWSEFSETALLLIKFEQDQKLPVGWKLPNNSRFSKIWSMGMNNMALSQLAMLHFFPDNNDLQLNLAEISTFILKRIIPPFGSFDIYNETENRFNFGLADVRIELNKINQLDTSWSDYLDKIKSAITEDNIKFTTNDSLKGFMPGMQGGYAGLGYFVLRTINPWQNPSILVPVNQLKMV